MKLKKLMEHISIIPDYRQAWKVEHKLSDILLLTICAVISGAEGWEDIEDFGETHLDFLKQYGDFEKWYSCSRYHCQSCILYQS
ncbi:transposase IS4 family protein [Escherichia coli]|uniref:Transposase IS4 family protein n=1 Tax=Escherichia coli TaxID=562 RepID=A0A377DAL6_ECOLX|nr:transposase IS4 family protein [Escherichia coli]